MTAPSAILCIGSVLWDVIGRAPTPMGAGADVPGRIVRRPGGVAMNVGITLTRLGLRADLLSAVGRDGPGDELVAEADRLGLGVAHLDRAEGQPTDRYMAIEDSTGLIAAIADAHSLEAAGDRILAPLLDGRIATAAAPFAGVAVLDGNLSDALLGEIATGDWLAAADLRVAPASPGKAHRLRPLFPHPRVTFYVNLEEAGTILGTPPRDTGTAAEALIARGAARALVTDGGRAAALADAHTVITRTPPAVAVTGVTGAGDTFMAAHIAAELSGEAPDAALSAALAAAAAHVSQEVHP